MHLAYGTLHNFALGLMKDDALAKEIFACDDDDAVVALIGPPEPEEEE